MSYLFWFGGVTSHNPITRILMEEKEGRGVLANIITYGVYIYVRPISENKIK